MVRVYYSGQYPGQMEAASSDRHVADL